MPAPDYETYAELVGDLANTLYPHDCYENRLFKYTLVIRYVNMYDTGDNEDMKEVEEHHRNYNKMVVRFKKELDEFTGDLDRGDVVEIKKKDIDDKITALAEHIASRSVARHNKYGILKFLANSIITILSEENRLKSKVVALYVEQFKNNVIKTITHRLV